MRTLRLRDQKTHLRLHSWSLADPGPSPHPLKEATFSPTCWCEAYLDAWQRGPTCYWPIVAPDPLEMEKVARTVEGKEGILVTGKQQDYLAQRREA